MGHYFINDANLKNNPQSYETTLLNKKFIFYTDSGVFSKDRLDYGTRLLIENLPYNELHGKVLDVGCGYGPIGLAVAKLSNAFVHMIDINIKAIELTKQNALVNGIKNILAYNSDTYENVNEAFDFIVTNPPIRAGKKIVYKIIEEAKDHLNSDGELWFVIRKQQGAESLIKNINSLYIVEIIDRSKGYYIIRAKKS